VSKHQAPKNLSEPVKSLVGPMEELYLVSFLAEGDESQARIEKALRSWADKWIVGFSYEEHTDQEAIAKLTPDEQREYQREHLNKAKQRMGEALAIACSTMKSGPLNDENTIKTGSAPRSSFTEYAMYAVRRWEK